MGSAGGAAVQYLTIHQMLPGLTASCGDEWPDQDTQEELEWGSRKRSMPTVWQKS